MSPLYASVSFTRDIPILLTSIFEYDIAKANISVLFNRGRITLADYTRLYNSDNMTRKVIIGKMERENPILTKEKQKGIMDAKQYLFEANEIEDHEVVSIKNDAVFVTRMLEHTKYGYAEFTLRNRYDLFMKVLRLELYYMFDQITGEEDLTIKGVNDSVLALHDDYILDFLRQLLCTYMNSGVEHSIRLLRGFYQAYTSRTMDINFYRDLRTGQYLINTGSLVYEYDSTIPDPNMIDMVDIRNNCMFFRALAKTLQAQYLRG